VSERYIVRIGSGLYRDNPTKHHPEGRPYHGKVVFVWDTKLDKRGKMRGPVKFFEGNGAESDARKWAERLNSVAEEALAQPEKEVQ
jgi:hypothetical protein